MKFLFSKPWESAIAVLHDNILGEETERWEKSFSELREELESLPSRNPGDERRTAPRFQLSLPVSHRVKNMQIASWEETRSLDISQNGIRIAIQHAIPIGTHLELNMKLPNQKKKIRMKGVVVWEKPSQNGRSGYECGVAFENFRNNFSVKGKIIQFMADRLCKLAMQESGEMTCRPATTKGDLLRAYELVYQEYQARKICKENSAHLHYNFFCMVPGSKTFVLEIKEKIVGTITLIVDSPCGIPMEGLFSREIGEFRKANRLIGEVSLLALDRQVFGNKSFSLTDLKKLMGSFRLFKIMFDYARFSAGVTDLFIAMHPKHKDLYQYLNFDVIGPVKSYERAEGKPALPMHLDVGRTVLTLPRELSIQRYFIEEHLPEALLNRSFHWTSDHVWEFLFYIRSIWHDLKPYQQDYFRKIYPGLSTAA